MLVPAVWLWTTITPGEDMVRLRNAIGAEVGETADFTWGPDNPPKGYLLNRGAVPSEFIELAQSIDPRTAGEAGGEFELGLAISRDLMKAPKRIGNPVQQDAAPTYQAITEQGRGYCADFVKAFDAMALGAAVPVRQWGFAFNGFGSGHTFNEIYDSGRGKWLMVDSFHSLYFVDPVSREPLSALEVHDRLLDIDGETLDVEIVRIVPDRFPFRSDELALDYYRRGMPQLWLVWGNNRFDYEASWPGRLESGVHRALGQLAGLVFDKYPSIRIYPKGLSQRDLNELIEGRNEFLLAAGALLVSSVVFGWQLLGLGFAAPSGRPRLRNLE
jgi:hypothetical protein